MRKLFIFLMCFVFSSYTIAEKQCWTDICWDNEQEMFLKAEKQFNEDQAKGLHGFKYNPKCEYSLASIAYGFANAETKLGKTGIGKFGNWYGIKKGSGKYQPMRKESMGIGNGHLAYPSPYLSTYDFMYLIKYAYGCKLTKDKIFRYVGRENESYYNNVLLGVKFFQRNIEKIKKTVDFTKITLVEEGNDTKLNLDDFYKHGSNDLLYFSNKGINLVMENVKGINILTYKDTIKIESKYSDTKINILYKDCNDLNEYSCQLALNFSQNFNIDNFSSNGVTYYKMPGEGNVWMFFKPGKYIYSIKGVSKFELQTFSKFLTVPVYLASR